MKTPIHLTEKHIKVGQPQSCSCCPIALAITEATGFQYIRVTPGEVKCYDNTPKDQPKLLWYAVFPFEVTRFIHNFDSYVQDLKPFSFEIEIITTNYGSK